MKQPCNPVKTLLFISLISFILLIQVSASAQHSSEQAVALNGLNSYLKTFEGGHYGFVEVTNGELFIRYKSGHSSNFKLNDISEIKILQNDATGTRVAFMCRDGQKCVYSGNTYTNYVSQPFTTKARVSAQELYSLMERVLRAFRTAQTPTPTPVVSAPAVLPNTDCTVILAGKGCGKMALGAAESLIESMLGKPDVIAEGNHRYYAFGIVIRYTSGRVVEQISFIRNSPYRGDTYKPFAGSPEKNVAWQASVQQIKGIYGAPQEHWDSRNLAGNKVDWLTYPNIKFELFGGTLREVVVGNFVKTAEQIAADKKSVQGPLMAKADQIVVEYKTMHDRLERNMSEYNRLAAKYASEMRLHLSGSAHKTREAMSRVATESINSIDAFIKKNEGFLAPSIKAHLIEDRQKFLD
ncbi:MAG: hypothetical protein IPO41_15570 [Acidobacteria bacterium]|nr:hypothetical protein [Acidobacteriota bacterium]